MQTKICALSMIAVLAIAGCAAEPGNDAAQPAEPVAATAASVEGGDEIVCRNEAQTGSRFKKQVCRRRSDIEAQTSAARQSMREKDRKGANALDPLTGT